MFLCLDNLEPVDFQASFWCQAKTALLRCFIHRNKSVTRRNPCWPGGSRGLLHLLRLLRCFPLYVRVCARVCVWNKYRNNCNKCNKSVFINNIIHLDVTLSVTPLLRSAVGQAQSQKMNKIMGVYS